MDYPLAVRRGCKGCRNDQLVQYCLSDFHAFQSQSSWPKSADCYDVFHICKCERSEQRARAGYTLTHRFKSIPLVQLPLHHRLMWFCSCWTWFCSFGITKGSGIYTPTTRGGSVSRFLGHRWGVECCWGPSRLQIRTGAKVILREKKE